MTSRGAEKLLASGWTFAQIPISVILRTDISDGAKTLLTYLCWRRNQDGETWPAIATMAEDMGVGESTARRRCRELAAHGLIIVTERRGQTSIYQVIVDNSRSPSSGGTPIKNEAPPLSSVTPPTPVKSDTLTICTLNDIQDDLPETASAVSVTPSPQNPPPKRVTWRTEIISEAQEYLWSQFGRKGWHTKAELELFKETEAVVGIEVMMRAAHWAAENGIAKIPRVCSAAKTMWKETPQARAAPQPKRETRAVRVTYPDGGSETMEIPI